MIRLSYPLTSFALFATLITACSASPSTKPSQSTTANWIDFSRIEIPARLRIAPVPATGHVTREAAVAYALANSPALRIARERLDVARAEYRQKSAANNPTLNAGASFVPHPVDDENAPRSQLFDTDFTYVSYVFPTSGRRLYNTRSAHGRVLAATEDLRTAELDLTQNVAQSYADLQVAKETIAILETNYRISLAFSDLANRQFTAGAVPETNVIRTQVEEARAELELRKAHSDLLIKEEVLGLHLAKPAGSRLAPTDPLTAIVIESDLSTLRARGDVARPEIVGALAVISSLRAETDLARSARRPDLTLESALTDRITNSGAQPIRAFVQLPLWDRGQIDGNVNRAKAEVRAAEAQLTQLRRQVALEIGRAYRQVESAQAVLSVLTDQVLPRTQTLIQRARVGYLAGAGTLLDLLDAQRVYRQAALDIVTATGDLARTVAAVERAAAIPSGSTRRK